MDFSYNITQKDEAGLRFTTATLQLTNSQKETILQDIKNDGIDNVLMWIDKWLNHYESGSTSFNFVKAKKDFVLSLAL